MNKKYIHFKLIWHINMICFQEKEIMIGTTSSRILYQLRDKYTICRCSWNVATHKMESSQWENWNNLFCGKFSFLILYIYMCLWLIVFNDIYDLIPVTSWPPFIFVSFVCLYLLRGGVWWVKKTGGPRENHPSIGRTVLRYQRGNQKLWIEEKK